MQKRTFSPLMLSLAMMLFSTACDSVSSSNMETIVDADATQETIINDELVQLGTAPEDVLAADVIFSLGWKTHERDSMMELITEAFAVAPLAVDTPAVPKMKAGLDLGDVILHYSGGTQAFHKHDVRDATGFFYTIGKGQVGPGPRGRRDEYRPPLEPVVIPFVPGGVYGFEYTGAGDFAATTIEVTAPASGMTIDPPLANIMVDTTADLTISWSGGVADQPVMVAVLPEHPKGRHDGDKPRGGGPHRGGPEGDNPRGDQSFGGPGLDHHRFKAFGLRYLLESNTGEYVVPVEDLKLLLEKDPVKAWHVVVTQLVTSEVTQNDLVHAVQLRISDRVRLKVSE